MILDMHGDPVPIKVERKSIGFLSQQLPDDPQETLTGLEKKGELHHWQDHEPMQMTRRDVPRNSAINHPGKPA